MEDVAPQLLEAIRKDFMELLGEARVKEMNYPAAEDFAEEVGEALVEAFRRNISAGKLPDGKMYWNIADRVIRPMLEDEHKLVADAAQKVQQALNQAAGIGMKAQRAKLDEDRVNGILNKTAAAEDFSDVAWVLDEPVKTFFRSVVDDTLRRNVEFQGKAGLQPRIIRTAESHCCKWCSRLGGVYAYPDVPKDVYRRHERCRCRLEYDPGRGKRKTLWTAGDAAQKKALAKKQKERAEQRKEKIKRLEQTDLDKMSLPQLRKLAKETATEYYKSGLSGISFGGHDMEKAAEDLANQGSRTSLKKDIRSMRKKMDRSDAGKSESGIIKVQRKLPDIQIGRSVGAKAKNYDIMGLSTGEMFHLAEETRIQNVEVFAGKGSRTPYRKAYKYANPHGGNPEDWQHVKGHGIIVTDDGDRPAEIHWSQCSGHGKHDFFIKNGRIRI